jgi:hypothetical protein
MQSWHYIKVGFAETVHSRIRPGNSPALFVLSIYRLLYHASPPEPLCSLHELLKLELDAEVPLTVPADGPQWVKSGVPLLPLDLYRAGALVVWRSRDILPP